MTERTTYERTQELFKDSFGVDMGAVGINSEQQFKVICSDASPAETVMHYHEEFDLDFIE